MISVWTPGPARDPASSSTSLLAVAASPPLPPLSPLPPPLLLLPLPHASPPPAIHRATGWSSHRGEQRWPSVVCRVEEMRRVGMTAVGEGAARPEELAPPLVVDALLQLV